MKQCVYIRLLRIVSCPQKPLVRKSISIVWRLQGGAPHVCFFNNKDNQYSFLILPIILLRDFQCINSSSIDSCHKTTATHGWNGYEWILIISTHRLQYPRMWMSQWPHMTVQAYDNTKRNLQLIYGKMRKVGMSLIEHTWTHTPTPHTDPYTRTHPHHIQTTTHAHPHTHRPITFIILEKLNVCVKRSKDAITIKP